MKKNYLRKNYTRKRLYKEVTILYKKKSYKEILVKKKL